MRIAATQTRHGTLNYYHDDEFVGRSLKLYGEYSEGEVTVINKILRPGDVAIDVGANIGALTIPMSKAVGYDGLVIAFEPYAGNHKLLVMNVNNNCSDNVDIRKTAASNKNGMIDIQSPSDIDHFNYGRIEVGHGRGSAMCAKIDLMHLQKCRLIKIDAEGHELEVIEGARETIDLFRPILYIENDRPEKSAELIAALVDMGYWLWWHRPPLFNPNNFNGEKRNFFSGIVSQMVICAHEDSGVEIDGCDDVADIRDDGDMFNREIVRYTRAIERHKKAGNKPLLLTARLTAAHYLNCMQRQEDANSLIDANTADDPGHAATLNIRGLMDLQKANWRVGWRGYELRYKQKRAHAFGARSHPCPQWDGKPTLDPILIWCEQGFGDTIMFSRFFRAAQVRAPNAFLEVQPELYELFQTSYMSNGLYRLHRSKPPYRQHCSLPSLPHYLGLALDSDMRAFPYLYADGTFVEHWFARGHPKIGLCCAGSPSSERPYTRDIPESMLRSVTGKHGPFLQLEQRGQFESFADTAAAIATLDLVITVDTSIAHLAGAMGVPVWLLLSFDPDWRWGLSGTRTIWYDSVRIFRQPKFRDWRSVVVELDEALTVWTETHEAAAE